MKTKVLFSYLILLLSVYIIHAAKLPNKNATSAVQQTTSQQTPTNQTKLQKSGRSVTAVSNATTATPAGVTSAMLCTTCTTFTAPASTENPSPKAPITTRKALPKKYIPTTQKPSTAGPLKISLSKAVPARPTKSRSEDSIELICPTESEANFELFAPPCRTDRDCTAWDRNERCCKLFGTKNCVKGVPKPLVEEDHIPILGLFPQKCPQRPLAELWWELKTCEMDDDCWPRICCPDGQRKYCRTASPEYEAVPQPIGRSIAYLSEYLECTPAPPPVFDLHPKQCNSTLDCFPNICCQESGRKHCRPPKKSVLTIMANFLNIGLVKRLTRNLVIK